MSAITKNHHHLVRHYCYMKTRTKIPNADITKYHDFPHQINQSRWCSRNFTQSGAVDKSPRNLDRFVATSFNYKFGLVGWYLGMVKARPVTTKSLTSAFIYTAADLSSQTITKKTSENYDLVRTSRMAGYGMCILGPSLHYWFGFVSRILPKRDLLSTVKKMVLGQTVYGPLLTVIFFSVNAALQGENGSEIVARLKRDFAPAMINGIMYWPACDFVTFRFVPVHLQPLVSNSFSYIWTIYMTYMANLEKAATSNTVEY